VTSLDTQPGTKKPRNSNPDQMDILNDIARTFQGVGSLTNGTIWLPKTEGLERSVYPSRYRAVTTPPCLGVPSRRVLSCWPNHRRGAHLHAKQRQ
jgi:hypothetical protein